MRTVSLRRRVTAASVAVLALTLIGFDLWLYVSFQARLTGELSQQLQSRASLAVSLRSSVAPQELADRLATGGVTTQVIQGATRYVGRPPSPPAPGQAPARSLRPPGPRAHPAAVAPVRSQGGSLTLTQPLGAGRTLVLSANRQSIENALSRLLTLEIVGTLGALGLAALALSWIVARALAPLDQTTAVAQAIAAGDVRQRLNPRHTSTELGRMAAAFDTMLDALEHALGAARSSELRMREFLSDAAHELRTPVAALQADAETLLRSSPPRDERERLTVRMIRDAGRAGRLVGDLLVLSRLDDDPALERTPFDLVALVRDELARADVLAPQLRLTLAGPVRLGVLADRDRVAQVLVNLLDNARHATPDGGTIAVEIAADETTAVVIVADSGPGIPPADRERIFQRFVRLPSPPGIKRPGSGLGLAIARGIAAAHGGTLLVLDSEAGARLELALPLRPPGDLRAGAAPTAPRLLAAGGP
jgi:two-component system OmpR family sensor kinase